MKCLLQALSVSKRHHPNVSEPPPPPAAAAASQVTATTNRVIAGKRLSTENHQPPAPSSSSSSSPSPSSVQQQQQQQQAVGKDSNQLSGSQVKRVKLCWVVTDRQTDTVELQLDVTSVAWFYSLLLTQNAAANKHCLKLFATEIHSGSKGHTRP